MITLSNLGFGATILLCISVGAVIGFICCGVLSVNRVREENEGINKDKILLANNILLKISLLKMIIGFAPKDENGFYYTGVDGFVSDAFVRLGIENHSMNEQMALKKIEALDEHLGEI